MKTPINRIPQNQFECLPTLVQLELVYIHKELKRLIQENKDLKKILKILNETVVEENQIETLILTINDSIKL